MTDRRAAVQELALGLSAVALLVLGLVLGLGNNSVYATAAAGVMFLAAALCARPTGAAVAQVLRLLAGLLILWAVYCQNSGWSAGVVIFMSNLVLTAALAVSGGLRAKRRLALRRWPGFAAVLVTTLGLVSVIGWSVPRLTADSVSRSQTRLVRYPAPAYTFVTLAGEHVDAAQEQGKVVVLDFWATWCNPCLQEWPKLNAFANSYRDRHDVAIYAIATRDHETLDSVRFFLASHHYHVSAAFDGNNALSTAFHAHGMPTLLIIDRAGDVRYVHSGYDRDSHLLEDASAQIDRLLIEPAPPPPL